MPYSFTTRSNGPGNTIDASHINDLQTAITRTAGRTIVPAVDSGFSWLNQGGASVTTDGDGNVVLTLPSGTTNLRGRLRACPSTPYTITAQIRSGMIVGGNSESGLLFYDGTKAVTWGLWTCFGGGGSRLANFTNVTTFGSTVSQRNPTEEFGQPLNWCRLTDDGTTLGFWASADGDHWVRHTTATRTAHMASGPTHVGWYGNNEAATTSTLYLTSWEET